MKRWIRRNWLYGAGALLGGLAGYLYWQAYGCRQGCTITSSPRNSTLYFAFLGALLFGMFQKKKAPPAQTTSDPPDS
jgi:hypothetical protein